MFDFEKLEIYSKAKSFHLSTQNLLKATNLDSTTKNQLRRASLGITLNIAEGSGRRTYADKKNFYVIARGSVFECIAILDIMKDEGLITRDNYLIFYILGEELSKMLYGMIQKLEMQKQKE